MAAGGPNPELSKLVQELELLRIVECPVCTEVPFPPIYICTAGHNICKSCKPKLKKCPTCKGDLNTIRNYTVEKIVLASKHFCPYRNYGCRIEETGELMESHIQTCQYRPFVCPAIGWNRCNAVSLRLFNVKDHFLRSHRDRVTQFNGQCFAINSWVTLNATDLEKLSWSITLNEFDEKTFVGQLFSRNRAVCWTVMIIGSEDEARDYEAEITCQSGKGRKIQWTIPVEPVCKWAELSRPDNPLNVFIPTCSFSDLKMMLKHDESNLRYNWVTSYIIKRNESATPKKPLLCGDDDDFADFCEPDDDDDF